MKAPALLWDLMTDPSSCSRVKLMIHLASDKSPYVTLIAVIVRTVKHVRFGLDRVHCNR